jgi:transketolase
MPRKSENTELDCINALRFLACDAIEEANSGHPGLPLGAAAAAYTLWTRHLKYDPGDPTWFDRDRFVLSAGHGSALLYALLHLSGYDLPLSEIRRFRQWASRTPGHPESHVTCGVEVTTGPLGQGLANAVGLAMAEAHLAATFNRPDHAIVDHHTYVLAGDGDLMEGVAYEATALAGHLRLGKLVILFDSNRISLAGSTALVTSEDVCRRFEAAGWEALTVDDGDDVDAIDRALTVAKADRDRPSLIVVRSTIGRGAPTKAGTYRAHGAPLGPEELAGAKRALGWPTEPAFHVPDDVRRFFGDLQRRAAEEHAAWRARFEAYRSAHPDRASELERRATGELPHGWAAALPTFEPDPQGLATRKASESVLQSLAGQLPELIGGSADLDPSTFTWLKSRGDFQAPDAPQEGVQGAVGGPWGYGGRNLHFGVREHAMGSIVNGLAQHGGILPYGATFLVFADYMRPPIRLAALSHYRSIFVFTHDSVAVGEDGPTHQPVEQTMSLRLIPGLVVLRPCDATETAEAWRVAVERCGGPTALVLSRQAVPTLDRSEVASADGVRRGGYVLWETDAPPRILLLATGSEVHLALEAAHTLAASGRSVRVVSLPSWELFDAQPAAYRASVLPPAVDLRVAVEAGRGLGWEHYVGRTGRVLSVDRFGASAPGGEVLERFGLTAAAIVAQAEDLLSGSEAR